jgi:hypothetical protein
MIGLIESIRQKNELLFYFGIICLVCALVTAILTQTSATKVLGVSAYYKPMKFFLSIGIFVWTFAYYMQYLDNQAAVQVFSWVVVWGMGFELLAITYQAARGKMSHFNTETAFDGFIFTLMGAVIAIVMLWSLYIGILFFTQNKFIIPPVFVWGIRLGIILTVIFSFEGFVMGSMLKHTVGAPDGTKGIPVLNWSKTHGDLRIAHFFGIHALQVVPLLCCYLAKVLTLLFQIWLNLAI